MWKCATARQDEDRNVAKDDCARNTAETIIKTKEFKSIEGRAVVDAIRIRPMMWHSTITEKGATGTLLTAITREGDTGHG